MSPVQPNKLETLDDLLAQAEHYANYSMRNMGRMPPTLFLVGPDGPLMFMPESLPDDGAKDDFATNPHDPYAVEILHGGLKLGCVPRFPVARGIGAAQSRAAARGHHCRRG